MIIYSTCKACGDLVQITESDQTVHPLCEPAPEPRPAPPMMNSALFYASLGWPVFPLLPFGMAHPFTGEVSDGKKPATRHGFKDAVTDAQQIVRWWSAVPEYNIGTPTGLRFDVIDIDVPEGLPILERLKQSDRAVHGWVNTASGGVHLYIKPQAGRANKAKVGVDWRGEGGYVVVPPSKIPDSGWVWQHPPSPLLTGRGDTYGASCE